MWLVLVLVRLGEEVLVDVVGGGWLGVSEGRLGV